MVGGGRALRAAVLFAVGGGQVGLGRASAEAHLAAGRGHLGHALLGLQSLRPDGTTGEGEKKKKEFTRAEWLPGAPLSLNSHRSRIHSGSRKTPHDVLTR